MSTALFFWPSAAIKRETQQPATSVGRVPTECSTEAGPLVHLVQISTLNLPQVPEFGPLNPPFS